ncbi:MAG: cupin domain-containing protein, partial [Planctomycetes bacterium]|nr:cupin domain-containing protein [Planctomycetota bacterium]
MLTFGGGPVHTMLLGGVFPFDAARAHPFYSALPPLVRLDRHAQGHSQRLQEVIRLIDRESAVDRPGRRSVVNRLVEILFIQMMRVHLGSASNGSIRGMLHPDLSTALALIHRQPEMAWTVAELAKRATMSRSAFSATFLSVLGKPPLRYLREHRMQVASRLLYAPSLGLKEIASR